MTMRNVYLLGWRRFWHQVSSQVDRYETLGINHHGVFVDPTAIFLSFCSFDMIDFLQHQERSQFVEASPKNFSHIPFRISVPSANMQLLEIADSLELLIISSTKAVAAPIP